MYYKLYSKSKNVLAKNPVISLIRKSHLNSHKLFKKKSEFLPRGGDEHVRAKRLVIFPGGTRTRLAYIIAPRRGQRSASAYVS